MYLRQQQGFALIILLTIIIMGTSFLLLNNLNRAQFSQQQDKKNAVVLAQAKKALLGYAVRYAEDHAGVVYPRLPCPDYTTSSTPEGSEDGNCGATGVNKVGRFPWRQLNLPPLRDSSQECLWYAVSGIFKNSPNYPLVNKDTLETFKTSFNAATTALNDIAMFYIYTKNATGDKTLVSDPTNPIVAVIFAPNKSLSYQNRASLNNEIGKVEQCGGTYTVGQYLDKDKSSTDTPKGTGIDNSIIGGNGADKSDSIFIEYAKKQTALNSSDLVNDQIAVITYNELMIAFHESDKKSNSKKWNNWYYAKTRQTELMDLLTQCVISNGVLNAAVDSSAINDFTNDAKYISSSGTRLGRLPASYLSACSTTTQETVKDFWADWKDHIFYLSAGDAITASSTLCSTAGSCYNYGTDTTVFYPAMLFFAGSPLTTPTQTRSSLSAKQTSSNYLEINSDFDTTKKIIKATGANDIVCKIKIVSSTLQADSCAIAP